MAIHKAFFVAGTDTGVGKTRTAQTLLRLARERGLDTAALKPVAAGCELTPGGLRNEDALLLQSTITRTLTYETINPVALAPAVAPHLAAAQSGKSLCVVQLAEACQQVLSAKAAFTLVEGAGGWRVPLNTSETMADLAKVLNLPVILVVGIRLGCLNHALLTAQAIVQDGLTLAGWVASQIDPEMPCQAGNIAYLKQALAAPCLGVARYRVQADDSSQELNLDDLLYP